MQLFAVCGGIPRPCPENALEHFLFMTDHGEGGGEGVHRRALATYALYRCHNALRTGLIEVDEVHGAFKEYLYEASRGDTKDTKAAIISDKNIAIRTAGGKNLQSDRLPSEARSNKRLRSGGGNTNPPNRG